MMWEDWGKHGTTSADTSAAVTEVPEDEDSDMAQDSEPEDDDLQEDDENDDATIDEPKRAKNRLDLLFLSDEEFDGALKGALRRSEKIKNADDSDAASDAQDAAYGESDDESNKAQGRKRKSSRGQRKAESMRASTRSRSASVVTTTKKRKTDKGVEEGKADKDRARGVSVAKDEKKQHDLRAMAEAGQGGRVMFVFEKISQSRM